MLKKNINHKISTESKQTIDSEAIAFVLKEDEDDKAALLDFIINKNKDKEKQELEISEERIKTLTKQIKNKTYPVCDEIKDQIAGDLLDLGYLK